MMLQADQVRVKELLIYDEITGLFTWKKPPSVRGGKAKIGAIAGTLSPTDGYWRIGFDGRRFAAHRLAWVYVHGVMPPTQMDHINGIRTDNRIANLRPATHTENMHNSRPRKSVSGLKGVHFQRDARNAWSSKISKGGKHFYLGRFATPEEAHAAYVKAAIELYGQFARVA